MQQKMKKLINYLIIGLTISGLVSCGDKYADIDYAYEIVGCINNQSSDSLKIYWYWENFGEVRKDSIVLKSGEFGEIKDKDEVIFSIRFDSVMLSNSNQKIVYIPYPRLDSLEHCIPLTFDNKLDPNKSTDILHYYSCTITDSTFQFMANECAKLGQDIWRKK